MIVREALDNGLKPPLQLVAVGCGDGLIGIITVSDDGDFAVHAVLPSPGGRAVHAAALLLTLRGMPH